MVEANERQHTTFEEEKELGLREYLEIFLKRKTIFIIVTSLIIVIGLSWTLRKRPPIYISQATVMIGPPTTKVGSAQNIVYYGRHVPTTEVELMESDMMAKRIRGILSEDKKSDFGYISIGEMLSFSLIPKNNFVKIKARSGNPKLSFALVSAAIQAYVDETKENRKKAIQETYDAFVEQLAEKREELARSEKELTEFVMEYDILARAIEAGQETEGESDINEKYLSLKSERIDKENFLEEIKRHRAGDEVATLSIIAKKEGELVDLTLRDELYEAEKHLSRLLLTHNELHPDIIETRGGVNAANEKITMEIDRAVHSLERDINTLEKEEEKLDTLIKEGLSEKMVQYALFKRDIEVKRSVYNTFIQHIEDLDITEKLGGVKPLEVVKAPSLPGAPIPQNKMKDLFQILLIAIVGGASCVYLLEMLDVSIKDVEDVEHVLGLTVLSAIPQWTKKMEGLILEKIYKRHKEQLEVGLVTIRKPESIISEAFKTLRTNIKFLAVNKNLKLILITSSSPKEGKSTISGNLAVAMARAGERVLLIDGDLRRPSVHKQFDTDNKKGFSSVLSGELAIDQMPIKDTEVENLKLMTSGPIPPNPSEILVSKTADEVIAVLKSKFDKIIIDSSPILTVADSTILATKADTTILVIAAHATAKKVAARAKLALKNIKANILGTVLNRVHVKRGGYYY